MKNILKRFLPLFGTAAVAVITPYAETVQQWIIAHPVAMAVASAVSTALALFLPQPHKEGSLTLQKAQSQAGRR